MIQIILKSHKLPLELLLIGNVCFNTSGKDSTEQQLFYKNKYVTPS